MSWSLDFKGDVREVDAQFREAGEAAKRNGLPVLERVDIGDTGNLVTAVAVKYGRAQGHANGHWILHYNGPELDEKASKFGAIELNIRLEQPEP